MFVKIHVGVNTYTHTFLRGAQRGWKSFEGVAEVKAKNSHIKTHTEFEMQKVSRRGWRVPKPSNSFQQ